MATHPDILARLDFARRAASAAKELILHHYSTNGVRFQSKPDGTPVTVADVGAEELVRDLILREFSCDGVLGEECGHTTGTTQYRWVIDPIDGTKSYIHGVPLFGTLIGIQLSVPDGGPVGDGWRSVAGVVEFPALDERTWAALGSGAWHQRGQTPAAAARVSAISRLEDSTISTTSPRAMCEPRNLPFYQRLNQRCKLSRGWSDCYGSLLVVTGRIEAMIDPPMKLWDVSALEPIVIEAGGKLTGWDNQPTDGSSGAITTNGVIHDALLALRG